MTNEKKFRSHVFLNFLTKNEGNLAMSVFWTAILYNRCTSCPYLFSRRWAAG